MSFLREIAGIYRRHPLAALLTDAFLVVLFALLGRASHHEPLGTGAVLGTAAPFLLALGGAWLLIGAVQRLSGRTPWSRPWPAGVLVWLLTLGLGMLLRVQLFGQTAAPAFLLVASIALAVLLLGPRLLLGAGRVDAGGSGPTGDSAGD